ncbi:SrfA family protein [Enterobacteriaceae bacterium H11S18]|uniref:SrfA family protein n=1 Tax=Dryocola clanedunensis TaxID=2925396 RepID=UPI0022F13089|nr:SrfA family protein [Dryocola clanedunensis]MCT4705640.1 SrfA family protein [Dryocola clanedunensis]MCT4711750.1 SrfA family protein [Dryocola clanedunensis]
MAKILLRSGSLDDFLALGENGQAVFDSALQIRETLRLRKQHGVADSLAIPQPNDEGDRVDWYAPLEGSVLSWAAASDEQRKKALRYLENCQANIATLIQRCQQAEKTAIQLFGSLLSNALQFPGSQHIYLVDGKPVITFWGFVNLNQDAREDVLDCLRVVEAPEPVIEIVPEPEPEPALPEPVPVPAPVPAEISPQDEPLVYSMPPKAVALRAPEPEPAEVEPETPPVVPVKTKSRLWMLPVAAAALVLIAAPVAYQYLSAPAAEPLANVKAEPQLMAPAAIKTVDQPVQPSTLPLVKASVVAPPPPPAPEPVARPEPAPAPAAKNALVIPAESLRIGSTKFLNGSLRVIIEANNPIIGKPPVLHYQIKDNKGTARLVHGDRVSCKVSVFSGLHRTGILMIKTRGSARCSDGSRYPMPEITCKPGDNGVAQCTGRYAGDTIVPLTITKVSD